MQGSKLPGLDVLRGIAILLVIVAHFLAPTLSSSIAAGNAGVILFFLLSGYLMDRNLANDPSIGRYAIRRAFRILPPYWLSIALIAFTTSNWTMPQVAANATFTAPLFGFERMSGVYWTLYIEITFYVLAPILCLLGERTIRFAPLVFAALISMVWAIRGVSIIAPMYILFCLTGMMIGSLHRSGLIPWFSFVTRMRSRPLEYCGHVSYSWYLTHFIVGVPILQLGAELKLGRWAPCTGAVIVSFLVSAVIFRYFEKPAVKIGKRIADEASMAPAAVR